MKHMSKMTVAEMRGMTAAVQGAAIEYAKSHHFSGLSHAGWFNFYNALEDAIEGEWLKATQKDRH